jgi:hypothetical protein
MHLLVQRIMPTALPVDARCDTISPHAALTRRAEYGWRETAGSPLVRCIMSPESPVRGILAVTGGPALHPLRFSLHPGNSFTDLRSRNPTTPPRSTDQIMRGKCSVQLGATPPWHAAAPSRQTVTCSLGIFRNCVGISVPLWRHQDKI